MLKRIAFLLCCVSIMTSLWAQTEEPKDGTYTVTRKLWNSSYMPKYQDQFVNGEGYRLYPGPLPKVLYALGRDTKDASVDWELLVNLDRDAPTWYGICNGWAASALLYDEPDSLVVNGVKILPGDHKSFLTTIFKDTTAQYYGATDRITGGMTPDSFEQTLFRFVVEANQSLVFDVSLDDEVWNYPIQSFTRESYEEGEWTYVKIKAIFPGLTPIGDAVGEFFGEEFVYDFRYRTASKTNYEWIGDSVDDHPQTAWYPNVPYLIGVDVANANHYYDLDTYDHLLSLSNAENRKRDLQEPNDTLQTAFKISNELVLGSLPLEESFDYYRFQTVSGEPVAFSFKVYDGRGVNLEILDPNGNTVAAENDTQAFDAQFIASFDGDYVLKIAQKEDAFIDSYYQIVFPTDASHFVSGPFGNDTSQNGLVAAVNTRNQEVIFSSNQPETVESFGSRNYAVAKDVEIRSSNRTLFSETFAGMAGTFKQYFLDHQKKSEYIVPHVTCRNGWKTLLEIRRQVKMPVWLRVYGQDGVQLDRIELPFADGFVYQGDLADLVAPETLAAAGWIDFETNEKLKGYVTFTGVGGSPIRLDITSRPRFGDMLVFDLKEAGTGGTGVAAVSTSAQDNEIIYWVENGRGEEVVRNSFMLKQGEKWLTTIGALVPVPMEDDFVFFMHSQFPVEGVVIQISPEMVYGHRLLGMDLDNLVESFATVPENRQESGFIFANFNQNSRHILFEGFSKDGVLQGRFNVRLGRAIQSREVIRVSVQEIFRNGVDIKDLDAITHLRMTSVDKFFGLELVDFGSTLSPMVVPLENVYENP